MPAEINQPRELDLDGRAETKGELHPKVLHAGQQYNGQPYIYIDENGIQFYGDEKKVISLSSEFGIALSGLISFAAMPEQISFGGGYWRINPQVLSCVPSTTPTPVPWLVKAEPRLTKGSKDIASSVSYMRSFSDAPENASAWSAT